MYIDSIKLENFRIFRKSEIAFVHSDKSFSTSKLPKPILPNINVLLGNNGSGKTTLLKAIALAALGPAVGATGNAKVEAQKIIDMYMQPNKPHTNCSRSFKKLFESDRAEAKAVFDKAWQLIDSIS